MKNKKLLTIIFILLGIVAFLLWVFGKKELKRPATFSDFKYEVEQNITGLMNYYQVPGAAVAVIENGKPVWIQTYGFSDKSKHILMNSQTTFQVGSISMAVTGWAIMKLVQEGKLKLDEPVERYLSRWHFPHSKYNDQVTIRRILSHSAGLNQRDYVGSLPFQRLPTIEESLSGKGSNPNQLSVIHEPGKSVLFSAGGYTLLQLIIEEVTKKPFSMYVEQEIFSPLQMKNSSFGPNPRLSNYQAIGYGQFGEALPDFRFTEQAATGLITSIVDLSNFVTAGMPSPNGEVAGRGILHQKTLNEMYKPTNKNYSLGYVSEVFPSNIQVIGNNGANRGWRAMFLEIVDRRDGIILMTNSDPGVNFIRDIGATWVKWKTGYSPKWYKVVQMPRKLVLFAVLFLGIGLITFIVILIMDLITKERRFIWKGFEINQIKRRLYWLTVPLLICVIWYFIFYAPIYRGGWPGATLMPGGFIRVTLIVFLWCLSILAAILVPKTNKLVKVSNSKTIQNNLGVFSNE